MVFEHLFNKFACCNFRGKFVKYTNSISKPLETLKVSVSMTLETRKMSVSMTLETRKMSVSMTLETWFVISQFLLDFHLSES